KGAVEDVCRPLNSYKLIRVYPNNNETLQYLNALYKESTLYDLDFWQPPTKIGAVVELTVGPRDAPVFLRDLEAKELHYTVTLNDLQQAIENEKSTPVFLHSEPDGYSYDKYHSLDEIYEEMLRLRRKNPNIISLIDIGESHENRSLLVIKISTKRRSEIEKKVAFWIDAGIHAREWIAPATAMYIVHELVHGYDNGISIRRILDHIDFYILPVMNPDGYEYSRLKNRMWRKNRRPYNCKHQRFHSGCCTGVDLNRNFDWFWSSAGSSTDPCHDTYPGLKAFSEAETVAVRDYLQANKPEAFITLHSYSQMWLIPYGHRKRSYPQDYHTALIRFSSLSVSGFSFIDEASGGSHDWAKGSLQVRYAYLIELRPKSGTTGYGFLLPEREISATGLETFEAIKVVAEEMVEQFVEPSTKRRVRLTTKQIPRSFGYTVSNTFHKWTNKTSSKETSAASPAIIKTTSSLKNNKVSGESWNTSTKPASNIRDVNRRTICVDQGSYCRLFSILNLCDRKSLLSMCAGTCHQSCRP
ncbi:hypothetical protein Angca_005841, partial [Angiostrongylus cantonensis]